MIHQWILIAVKYYHWKYSQYTTGGRYLFSLALGTLRINFESLNVEPDSFIQSDYMPSQPRGKKIDPRLLQHVPLTGGFQ